MIIIDILLMIFDTEFWWLFEVAVLKIVPYNYFLMMVMNGMFLNHVVRNNGYS